MKFLNKVKAYFNKEYTTNEILLSIDATLFSILITLATIVGLLLFIINKVFA